MYHVNKFIQETYFIFLISKFSVQWFRSFVNQNRNALLLFKRFEYFKWSKAILPFSSIWKTSSNFLLKIKINRYIISSLVSFLYEEKGYKCPLQVISYSFTIHIYQQDVYYSLTFCWVPHVDDVLCMSLFLSEKRQKKLDVCSTYSWTMIKHAFLLFVIKSVIDMNVKMTCSYTMLYVHF